MGNFNLDSWKKKRRRTVGAYLLCGAIVGVDYSVVFATLYPYLTDLVKTDKPKLYYGLTIASFCLCSTILGPPAGRFIDKTRKMKLYTNFVLVAQIIGNLLYAIHFHPIYLVIGRFIAGIANTFGSICSGEIVRLYDSNEGTSALWWLASSYSVGFALGPCFGIIFKGAFEFNIGSLTINYLNFVGIFVAAMTLLVLIIVNFFLYDCSAEFDLKKHIKEHDECCTSPNNDTECGAGEIRMSELDFSAEVDVDKEMLIQHDCDHSVALVLKTIITNPDALLMFVSSFMFMYCLMSLDLLIPLIELNLLGWSLEALTLTLVTYGITYFFALLILSKYCTSKRAVYYVSLVCIVFQLVLFVIMIAMKRLERNLERDVTLMVLFMIGYIFVWFIEMVLLRTMVAKMVPSNIQRFTEALRKVLSGSGTVIAALTEAFAISALDWWSIGMEIAVLILLFRYHLSFKEFNKPCIVYCVTKFVYCVTKLVYCVKKLAYFVTKLMYCVTKLVYCVTKFVYCVTKFVYCVTKLVVHNVTYNNKQILTKVKSDIHNYSVNFVIFVDAQQSRLSAKPD
ncbi:uncharacterized protein LOC130644586 [Hydractinia symbiolongicarpus]|uniref:uncharacterized protein LOC130644586 n=1 Tax=Hydractinia symbiolongicarpus TaxID=13093 RepID=UPI00254D6522|nr:uncharacterized protein LOC130644586 [Hydractinia symbiolongicarpus]